MHLCVNKYLNWNIVKLAKLARDNAAYMDDGEALWMRQQCKKCVTCRRMETVHSDLLQHNTRATLIILSCVPFITRACREHAALALIFQHVTIAAACMRILKTPGHNCGFHATPLTTSIFLPPSEIHWASGFTWSSVPSGLYKDNIGFTCLLQLFISLFFRTRCACGVNCVAATANQNALCGVFRQQTHSVCDVACCQHWNGIFGINPERKAT